MARNDRLFNSIQGVPGRNQIDRRIRPPGTREGYDPEFDANWTGDQAGPEETGVTPEGQGFTWSNMWASMFGSGNFGWGEGDVNNMNDMYDQFLMDQWAQDQGMSFIDWMQGAGGMADYTGYDDFPGGGVGGSEGWSMQGQGPGSGGGASGGAGDIGYGSMFAGGGYEGGITNPFGECWDAEGYIEGCVPSGG